MWADFSGKAYSREDFAARIASLKWTIWKPIGITLHNTSAPTLAQWAESGPKHDARIRNLQSYYEGMGWHGGPHWFISRNWLNEFSNPLRRGTHSRCYNATHFGIEMVGDYSTEPFNSGDGAMVRDNAVFAMATLCNRFGFKPERDIVFHKECKLDNHDCPGKLVDKSEVITRVRQAMAVPHDKPTEQTGFVDIVATVFADPEDIKKDGPMPSAYGGIVDPSMPGVALPAKFAGHRPKVKVTANGRSVVCEIVDVGPWNGKTEATSDPYWETKTRPQAESGIDKRGRKTNKAGIDLTPAAARAIGINGKGVVSWDFCE